MELTEHLKGNIVALIDSFHRDYDSTTIEYTETDITAVKIETGERVVVKSINRALRDINELMYS